MYKVMLVDDSEISLRMIKQCKIWDKTSNFIICSEAFDGEEALTKLGDSPVDLLITDIHMPKMNGFELLTKATERGLTKTGALLSAHRNFDYARQGLILGAFDYMVKPVGEADIEKLLKRVAKYLEEIDTREKRLRELEENQINKYLHIENKLLVASIVAGSAAMKNTCHNLIQASCHWIDTNRLFVYVQMVLEETISALEERFPWLDKFINLNRLRSINYSEMNNAEQIEEAFAAIIGILTRSIHKLSLGNGSNVIVDKACNYILQNIDKGITVKSLSQSLFLHRSYLSEIFRRQTEQRLNEYLIMIKLERAKRLLEDGGLSSYQIALKLGYRDAEYFSRVFKNHTGMLPSQYKGLG